LVGHNPLTPFIDYVVSSLCSYKVDCSNIVVKELVL
jgi:hypothetical protein